MKLTVCSKAGWLTELTAPLYDRKMAPLWKEHPEGPAVDAVIYPLPRRLEDHFVFVDIQDAVSDTEIDDTVAKDVFILGYPFSKEEMKSSFGINAAYYLPIWKRGSIATEPRVRLGGRILLIDSLSRPGMSGAPVVIAQDEKMVHATDARNSAILGLIRRGEIAARDAIRGLDAQSLRIATEKQFNFLGLYSGVIGNTRLQQVALGKCWHFDTLRELAANHRPGVMPYHSPMPNQFYEAFIDDLAGGELIRKNVHGEIVERVPL